MHEKYLLVLTSLLLVLYKYTNKYIIELCIKVDPRKHKIQPPPQKKKKKIVNSFICWMFERHL